MLCNCTYFFCGPRREVHDCANNWLEGVRQFVWADEDRLTLLPLPLGVGVMRDVGRQGLVVRSELDLARRRLCELLAEHGGSMVDTGYVKNRGAMMRSEKHPSEFNVSTIVWVSTEGRRANASAESTLWGDQLAEYMQDVRHWSAELYGCVMMGGLGTELMEKLSLAISA